MLKLTGLWKGVDRNGNSYLSGSLGTNLKVLVFPNTKKKGEKEPDYALYLAEPKREGQDSGSERPQRSDDDPMPF